MSVYTQTQANLGALYRIPYHLWHTINPQKAEQYFRYRQTDAAKAERALDAISRAHMIREQRSYLKTIYT